MIGTFGSQFSMEQALSRLEKVEGITFQQIDAWTLIVRLKDPTNKTQKETVSEIIASSKGYLEKDFAPLSQKKSKDNMNPLDYPIFG